MINFYTTFTETLNQPKLLLLGGVALPMIRLEPLELSEDIGARSRAGAEGGERDEEQYPGEHYPGD